MDNRSKETMAKIQSLIERTESHVTYNEAMERQSQLITEATRVGVNSFLEFLTKYAVNKGPFVRLGYIQLYQTDPAYPTDEYYKSLSDTRGEYTDNGRNLSRFDGYMDKVTNSEWNSPTGKKKPNHDIYAMGKKLYPYLLKMTNYTVHWQSYENYNERYNKANQELSAIRDKMTDDTKNTIFKSGEREKSNTGYYKIGPLGDYDVLTFGRKNDNGDITPERQEYLTDPDDFNSAVKYERTAIKNFMPDAKQTKTYYFGVDENGNIDPLPYNLGKLLYSKITSHDKQIAAVTDEEQRKITEEYFAKYDSIQMANKTFIMQNVAYICGSVTDYTTGNKQSVYWVNKEPLFLLSKRKTINKKPIEYKFLYKNISNDELSEIINRYAKNDADEIEAMANQNIKGTSLV
jgi:hypothetical protein